MLNTRAKPISNQSFLIGSAHYIEAILTVPLVNYRNRGNSDFKIAPHAPSSP